MKSLPESGLAPTKLYHEYWQKDDAAKQNILREHYEQRNALDPYATSRDYNQRELEIYALNRALAGERPGNLVDFGCGNGYTLLSVARDIPGWRFEGVDFARNLIDGANSMMADAKSELKSDVVFHCGDAIARVKSMPNGSIDCVLTERFLLNLPSKTAQHDFIRQVHRVLKRGGIFLMCECSMDGFRGLNKLRKSINLPAIPETSEDNLSAIRFEDTEIEQFVASSGFELIRKEGFSYFFATSRALHPVLVAPEAPKFNARINDLARQLQMQMPFTAGIGSNVLWVLKKA